MHYWSHGEGNICFVGLSAQFTQMSSDIILKSRDEDVLTVPTQKFYLCSPKALTLEMTLQLPCYNGAPFLKKNPNMKIESQQKK